MNESHPAGFYFCLQRSKPHRQNIVLRLFDQKYRFSPKIHPFVITHKLHQNIVPNFSIENAERPNCFLRKFTNDGRYLIAFNADITSIELYAYQGPAAASQLLSNVSSKQDYLNYRGEENVEIRRDIFNCFFQHKDSIKVCSNGDQLNRECSIFTEDNRFLVVASTSLSMETSTSYHDRYQNNESIPISERVQFEDYKFHSIDMEEGKVIDRLCFKADKINVSYNHGVYLYKNLFAILSVQHQTIHLYYILPDGHFVFVRNIGRFCFEDDEQLLNNYYLSTPKSARNKPIPAFREVQYSSLKHRILVFVFKQAKKLSEETKSSKPLYNFYRDFNFYVNLRMWKMQLLDDEHIMIKYEQQSTLINKIETNNFIKHWNLFVIYNWKTGEILNIFPQHSSKLLNAFENFCDYFRHPRRRLCSLSNNYHARRVYEDFKKSLYQSKNGSYKDAIRIILSALPHCAQAITPSPYVDLSLFSYDEKMICFTEKPRVTSEVPIRFYDRQTNRLLFRLHTGQVFIPFNRYPAQHSMVPNRRLIAFIFHPFDPFIISVQRYNSHYLLHFHIRHSNPL